MRRHSSWWLAVGTLALVPMPAVAQGFAGDVGACNIQRRLSYQSVVYEQTGVALGAAGTVRLGPVQLRLSGLFGTLKGDGSMICESDDRDEISHAARRSKKKTVDTIPRFILKPPFLPPP